MASIIKVLSMVSTERTWTEGISRSRTTKGSSCLKMSVRQPGLTGVRSSSEGSTQEQYLQKMPDLPAWPELCGAQRGRCPAEAESLGRTEEYLTGGRRRLIVSALLLSGVSALLPGIAAAAAAIQDNATEVPLELYNDFKEGFTLKRPAPWNKVNKPGASIFFEDPESRNNNIGVTVAPVRIASLIGFGTVDDIVKKLVKAEKDKPSTKDIQVVEVSERKLRGSTPLYSLEYILDTTRGSKRVLTSVTVADYKLYVLSIVFADGPVAPASQGLNDALHQVLNSFQLLAQL